MRAAAPKPRSQAPSHVGLWCQWGRGRGQTDDPAPHWCFSWGKKLHGPALTFSVLNQEAARARCRPSKGPTKGPSQSPLVDAHTTPGLKWPELAVFGNKLPMHQTSKMSLKNRRHTEWFLETEILRVTRQRSSGLSEQLCFPLHGAAGGGGAPATPGLLSAQSLALRSASSQRSPELPWAADSPPEKWNTHGYIMV